MNSDRLDRFVIPYAAIHFRRLRRDDWVGNLLSTPKWAYCIVGGYSVVHFSGLYRLARALATGEATVLLQAFQNIP